MLYSQCTYIDTHTQETHTDTHTDTHLLHALISLIEPKLVQQTAGNEQASAVGSRVVLKAALWVLCVCVCVCVCE
jgi:hypothetical protein